MIFGALLFEIPEARGDTGQLKCAGRFGEFITNRRTIRGRLFSRRFIHRPIRSQSYVGHTLTHDAGPNHALRPPQSGSLSHDVT